MKFPIRKALVHEHIPALLAKTMERYVLLAIASCAMALSSREGSALGKHWAFGCNWLCLPDRRIFNCFQNFFSLSNLYKKKSINKCYSFKGLLPTKDLSVLLWTVEVSALSMQELTNFPPLKLAQLCFCSLSFKHVNIQEKIVTLNAIVFFISSFFSKPHTHNNNKFSTQKKLLSSQPLFSSTTHVR